MTNTRNTVIIILSIVLGIYILSKMISTKPIVETRVEIDTVLIHLIDTIKVETKDTVFVDRIIPVLDTTRSIATLDTAIIFKDSTYSLGVKFSLSFDLKDTVFTNFRMSLFDMQVVMDTTIQILERKEIIIQKPSKWKYVEAGIIGAAVGVVVWTLAQ